MSKFDSIGNFMRVEILIDPDTGDYQVDLSGSIEDLKEALQSVLSSLDDPEIIAALTDDDDPEEDDDEFVL